MDIVPQKRCNRCGVVKPLTDFHKLTSASDGHKGDCKVCLNADQLARRNADPIKYALKDKAYRENNKDKVKNSKKKWTEENAEYIKVKAHQHYIDHKSEKQEYDKKRYVENPEKAKVRSTQWKDNNPDLAKLAERKWKDANPDKILKYSQAARTRKKNLPYTLTNQQWEACLSYWDDRCCVCGRKAGFWNLIVKEHWIALADPRPDNPGTVANNILPMCHSINGSHGQGSCNQSKRNRDPVDWLTNKYGKRKASAILKRITAYFEFVEN